MGLGYDALAERNPGLVLVRVTGFGQDGPYAPRAGYGSIGEAMGGAALRHRRPLDPAERSGISIGDSLAGTFAALGTMLALHARGRSGRGQVVDSAIYEAVLAMMESLVTEYQVAGYTRERTGPSCPTSPPPTSIRPPTGSWCWSPPTRTCSGAWPG